MYKFQTFFANIDKNGDKEDEESVVMIEKVTDSKSNRKNKKDDKVLYDTNDRKEAIDLIDTTEDDGNMNDNVNDDDILSPEQLRKVLEMNEHENENETKMLESEMDGKCDENHKEKDVVMTTTIADTEIIEETEEMEMEGNNDETEEMKRDQMEVDNDNDEQKKQCLNVDGNMNENENEICLSQDPLSCAAFFTQKLNENKEDTDVDIDIDTQNENEDDDDDLLLALGQIKSDKKNENENEKESKQPQIKILEAVEKSTVNEDIPIDLTNTDPQPQKQQNDIQMIDTEKPPKIDTEKPLNPNMNISVDSMDYDFMSQAVTQTQQRQFQVFVYRLHIFPNQKRKRYQK